MSNHKVSLLLPSPYLAVQEEVVWFYVTMDESQLVDGVNGQHGLSNVELCLLLCQSILLHQQCHHVTWKPPEVNTRAPLSLSVKTFLEKSYFCCIQLKTAEIQTWICCGSTDSQGIARV